MSNARAKLTRTGFWYFAGVMGLNICAGIIAWLNQSTQLWPYHPVAREAGLSIACIAALVSIGFIFRQSSGSLFGRVTLCLVGGAGLSAYGAYMFTTQAIGIIQIQQDFPKARSHRFPGVLQIEQAFRQPRQRALLSDVHYIQTQRTSSTIRIMNTDYQFMLAHRRSDDPGSDPNKIASSGYFCAKVQIEQAGDALRVLHAGSKELAAGSIGICGEVLRQNPGITLIR